jgi:hypothetical protein
VVGQIVRELPDEVQDYIRTLENMNQSLEKKTLNLEKSKGVLEQKIDQLTEELRLALFRRYGRSSEKIDPNQKELFGEVESEADEPAAETDHIVVPSHQRKKPAESLYRPWMFPSDPRSLTCSSICRKNSISPIYSSPTTCRSWNTLATGWQSCIWARSLKSRPHKNCLTVVDIPTQRPYCQPCLAQ